MKRRILNTLLLSILCAAGFAQVSFTDASNKFASPDTRSGAPMAVYDVNGDFLDDIIRLNETSDLTIEYQSEGGTFTSFLMDNAISGAWAICVADVDNDGMSEIMAGGAYNGVSLFRPMGNGEYMKTSMDGPSLFVQGMNFADINNDGFIDAFACHDDGASHIWGNNGFGDLSYNDTDFIDLNIFPSEEDNSGNYGSVWTDFDSDGDLDLYIAKCRQGSNNSTDPRRINQLWVNDGDNNYSENAVAHGLAIGWQSWTAEFQDIDNDGDFDAFITNHDHQSQLLENVNNQFIDITPTSGVTVTGLPVQAAMKDFDNDGFVDILVTGQFFHNNGDKTFTEITPNPLGNIHSFGLGDLNHDGFIDVCAGYGTGFNGTGNINDKLWLNEGNDNNWLAVNLIGQESNRGGIGARIEVAGTFGTIVREVRAGESYGIVHSLTQHFGIGTADEIETVTIKWPSGVVDIFENPAINEFLNIIENNCISLVADVELNGETSLCSGETLDMTAPMGYTYLWSTGEATQSITVEDQGNYSVTIADDTGCFGVSQTVSVIVDPEEFISIEALGDTRFCEGGSVELVASESSNYTWSTGENAQSVIVSAAGTYSVSMEGACSTVASETITIETLASADMPVGTGDLILNAGTAILQATGNNPRWFAQEIGGDLLGEGNTFETPYIEETTVFYVEDANLYGGGAASGGAAEHTGSSEYSGNQFNGQLIFDCYEPFVLTNTTVFTDLDGERIIELINSDGEVLQSKTVNLEVGENVITLDFAIEPAEGLALTTNLESNLTNFGFESPRMKRTSSNGGGEINYPYDVSTVATMYESNFGDSWYYFFYDWQVEKAATACASPRVAVEAVVEPVGVYSIDDNEAIQIFPNPTSTHLTIELQAGNAYTYQLMDMTGKVVHQNTLDATSFTQTKQLDVSKLAKGMYFIQFMDSEHVYAAKVSIQ